MAKQITQIQVFLASPSDVWEERKVVGDVIAEINRTIAPDLGFLIRHVNWEDMTPKIDMRAEKVILDQAELDNTDVFVGILWNRFGTPTGHADSGTEEEFNVAYETWKRHQMPCIMFYFCHRPSNLVKKEELEQKLAVLNFKEKIGKLGIFREFATTQELETSLRQDITKHLLYLKKTVGQTEGTVTENRLSESSKNYETNKSFQRGQKAPEGMIRISAGSFLAGPAATKNSIDNDFYIDVVPVTNKDFSQFIQETGFMIGHPFPLVSGVQSHIKAAAKSLPDHPVTMVTWYDAQAYAAWAGKRLPTAMEWERAARGKSGRIFPWGDEFDPFRCNSLESGVGHTTPVRQYGNGRSEDGCFDLAGNVFEWTSDWAITPRFSNAPNSEKINRGASYARNAKNLVCWYTESDPPDLRMSDVGFRCAWTPD
jgi:formylglycine-generating enzyme required for sulfatase activity